MRLLLLLLVLLPYTTHAETLQRSFRDPAPKPLALTKEFFHFEELPATCTRQECHTVNMPQRKEVCHDETKYETVCRDQFTCKMVNGQRKCGYERKCAPEWTHKKVCEWKYVSVPTTFCKTVKYACTQKKKIHERDWKVTLNTTFDPRAALKRGQDEKFSVSLAGDEHEPKLEIKTLRSPFKYLTDYRFEPNNSAAVDLDFRLDEGHE